MGLFLDCVYVCALFWATGCGPQKALGSQHKWRRGINIPLRVLPLPGESRQAVAAVVCLGAVPSVEAAVVPSRARAGGDGELRKPGGRNGTNVSPPSLTLCGSLSWMCWCVMQGHLRVDLNVPRDFRDLLAATDKFVG